MDGREKGGTTMAHSDARAVAAGRNGALTARNAGLVLGAMGLVAATVTFINALVAGSIAPNEADATRVAELAAWGFGLAITGFALGKLGIASVLSAIVSAVRGRAAAATQSVPALMKQPGVRLPAAEVTHDTPYGRATAGDAAPPALTIHRVAAAMWKPMLAMGAMAIAAGFAISLVQTNSEGSDALSLAAWAQGTLFLGEGFLLSGISFLLGTILGVLRAGGGRVQEASSVTVRTLRMPVTAKLFLGLMMAGLMVEIGQFVAYGVVSALDVPSTVTTAFAWLGPVREFGLGLLLSGIVLALATIAKVLGFQFWRLQQIISDGR
jgi:hypothetical protein